MTPRSLWPALVALVALVCVGCGSAAPESGDALGPVDLSMGLGKGWLLGQRYIDAQGSLINKSDESLTLVSVEPVFAYGRRSAEVYRTAVFVPAKTAMDGPGGEMVGGLFLRWPPSFREAGTCTYFRLRPVRGETVGPGKGAALAMFIHMARPGKWQIKGEWVTYRQNGTLYRQFNDYAVQTRVRARGAPYSPGHFGEKRCHTRPLSQAMHAPLSETGHP
ncbi:hypothetical protein [Nocardioides terrisoli]|uniref:hypothetical protein n=1 Tax=Nocardioides terrisoli TaxID=3388267 RepID=UPI00287BB8A6|nr:hypothetical protein [Nocardioides marmorisolisilvae]